MNKSLSNTHLGLIIFYGLIAAVVCGIHVTGDKASWDGFLILLCLFSIPVVFHSIALLGVRKGKSWGRNMSRALGFFLLFAVPIGTAIGGYILMRTGKRDWQAA